MSESVEEIRSKMADNLSWKELENFIADLWELQGYSTEVTGHHDKEGEDVIAIQEIPYPFKIFIQAKRQKANVGKNTVQMHSLHVDADADLFVIVTTSSFTSHAINLANLRKSTKLVNGEALAKLVKKINAEELLEDYVNSNDPREVNVNKYKYFADGSAELHDISGIGKKYASELAKANIYSVPDLLEINPEILSEEIDVPKSQLERWITEAAYQQGQMDVVRSRVPDEEIETITGIGPSRAKKLKNVGIETVGDLAVANHREVAENAGFAESTIQNWAQRARDSRRVS